MPVGWTTSPATQCSFCRERPNRRDAIQTCFELLLELVDEVLPIDLVAVRRARKIVLARADLTARDAVHVAVMERHGITEILSLDRHLDGLPGIVRMH